MGKELLNLISGEVLEEDHEITLAELCRVCGISAEEVFEFVDQGLIEPQGRAPVEWRFHGICVRRIHSAQRLRRDLSINLAGAALVLDLLDELEEARIRLHRLEHQQGD